MKISFNSDIEPDRLGWHNGYGYATERMLSSLDSLGYHRTYNDGKADVGISFDQPKNAMFFGDQYKVMYHPWESTLLKKGWAGILNEADEVWTPSPLIAQWYTEHAGIVKPVHVYEHGVDKIWTPKKREVRDTFRFLHVGAEAARKGGTDVMRAFRKAFSNNEDVELTLKIISRGWGIASMGKINVVNAALNINELVALFHSHHAYVYPSWGEGFGLTPLQAIATGMPTITVPAWAPYRDYLDPNLSISSKLSKSPWPQYHPGNMLEPSQDDLVDAMRYAYDNYDSVRDTALARVPEITQKYDWDSLTGEAFGALEHRLNLS